ncbi:hypothetical protein D3C81_1424210 [compost metagenome]
MHEVGQVSLEVAGLGVHLRVGGHFQVEVIGGFLANEFDQVAGVAQFATGHAHTRWQVATQGDDALDACSLVFGQQGTQFGLGVAYARQVRCGRYLHFAFQLQHGVQRAVAGRATGTVGAGEEVRVVGGQLAGDAHQLFVTGIGLGREELETVTAFLGHQAFLWQQASSGRLQVKARSVMAGLAWASFKILYA